MFNMNSLSDMLFEAMHCKDGIKRAKILVEQGGSIHVMDFEGWTTLHHAAYYGQVKNIGWLLNQGLDINCRNYNGKTPLDVANSAGETGAVKFLKMKGGKY